MMESENPPDSTRDEFVIICITCSGRTTEAFTLSVPKSNIELNSFIYYREDPKTDFYIYTILHEGHKTEKNSKLKPIKIKPKKK